MSRRRDTFKMERRKFLKSAGAVGTAFAAAGAGIAFTSGGASATAGSNISDPDIAVSDDGTIRYVNVKTTGRMKWDGFDTPAQHGRIVVQITLKRNGNVLYEGTLHDTGIFALNSSWGASGEEAVSGREGYIASDADWDIVQAEGYQSDHGLPNNPAPADRFTSHEDDNQVATVVEMSSTYHLYDADENELTGGSEYPDPPKASSSFTVRVKNQKSQTEFGGSDAEGDSGDSASVGV